jgi:hypothetical protein
MTPHDRLAAAELIARFPIGSRAAIASTLFGRPHRLEGTVTGYHREGLVCLGSAGCFDPELLAPVEREEDDDG